MTPTPPPSPTPAPPTPTLASRLRDALDALSHAPPWVQRYALQFFAAGLLALVPHMTCGAGRDVATAVANEAQSIAAELRPDAGTLSPLQVLDGGAGAP